MQKNTSKDIVSLIFGDSIVYGLYDNLRSKREQDELLEVWKI